MNFNDAKEKILLSLCGAVAAAMVWIAVSVTQLNTSIAVVVNTVGFQGKQLEQFDKRLINLEGNK